MNEVREKLPRIFENGGNRWEILKREGNFILISGRPISGMGMTRYDVCMVHVDEDGCERVTINHNYDGTRDSPTFSLAAMTGAFNESVNRSKALARQKLREQEQERQKIVIDAAWEKLTDELRTEQAMLINELKSLSKGKTSLSKRSNEIALRLAVLEQIFHHGRPRLEL